MSIETGVVVFKDGLHWHTPEGRSSVFLPDSRTLWDIFWENRDRLVGFAHSHPGVGTPSPSMTDVTTFMAIEKALGKKSWHGEIAWWVISKDRTVECLVRDKCSVEIKRVNENNSNFLWVRMLREFSYGGSDGSANLRCQ